MAFRTSWSLEPRAPSTASNAVVVWRNDFCAWAFTIQTVMRRPPASARLAAVMIVEKACCLRLR